MKQIIRSLGCCLAAVLILAACSENDEPLQPEDAIFFYMPWAGNLHSDLVNNINGMCQTITEMRGKTKTAIVVIIADNDHSARLVHLKYNDNKCTQETIKEYNGLAGYDFYSENGMSKLFSEAKASMPVSQYSMVIGCHGMGWLPIDARNDYAKPSMVPSSIFASYNIKQQGIPVEGTYLTRYFGDGVHDDYNAEISTLVKAIRNSFGHIDFLLLDDCHMMNIEVAYDLKDVTDYVIGSTCEVMAKGLPYDKAGRYLINKDYEQVVEESHTYFTNSRSWGTLAVAKTSEIQPLADVMRQINATHEFVPDSILNVQKLDGFTPTVFYDMKSYVKRLCADDVVLFNRFEQQLLKAVPYAACTDSYYSARTQKAYPIREFSGITISDPSWSYATRTKETTAWWKATHEE